jgi:DNA-binding MarR family transcriptional regulator
MIYPCNNRAVESKEGPKTTQGPSGSEGLLPAAFLIAQLGSFAATRFAARLAPLDLTPAHAGILRILHFTPAMTQQALATRLGMVPSRLVTLLDDLESRNLIERGKNQDDRRRHALTLTAEGHTALQAIGEVAREHQRSLLAVLSPEEQRQLAALLQRVADGQGLTPGVHPGYKTLKIKSQDVEE